MVLFNQSRQEAKQNYFLIDQWCRVMFINRGWKIYKFSSENDECLRESWAWSRRDWKVRNDMKVSSCYGKVSETNLSKRWIQLLLDIIKTDTAGVAFILLKIKKKKIEKKVLAQALGSQHQHRDRRIRADKQANNSAPLKETLTRSESCRPSPKRGDVEVTMQAFQLLITFSKIMILKPEKK